MDLNSPLTAIKGIGPKTSATLEKAGLKTFKDLLYYLPRTYDDFQQAQSIKDLKPGKITVKAKLENPTTRRLRRNLSLTEATLRDETGALRTIWFNQPYRAKQFDPEKDYYFSGNLEYSYGRYQLTNPSAILAADYDKKLKNAKIQPVYPVKGSVKSADFKKYLASLTNQIALVPDQVPNLKGRADALLNVHFPDSLESAQNGRNYLATEELFCFILSARLNRQENQKLQTTAVSVDYNKLKSFIEQLPFKLTNAQRRATWEILQISKKLSL